MPHEGEDRAELAEDRTGLAEDRTLLASERTYASWMRTGMASIAVALGFRALLHSFEPAWVVKLIASAFVLTGAAVIWFAYRRACALAERLGDERPTALPISRMGWLSVTLVLAALALGVVLWRL
jgi:putative membrane protein